MKIYEFLKNNEEFYQARIIKDIEIGLFISDNAVYIMDQVGPKYLDINKQSIVFIKSGSDVDIRYTDKQLEIVFDDTVSICNVSFDNIEDYDKHFKLY